MVPCAPEVRWLVADTWLLQTCSDQGVGLCLILLFSPVGVRPLHQPLILILNAQLPLLLNRAVNSLVWLNQLLLQYVVILLRVIKESLSVDSSPLLDDICVGVLLCSGEVIFLVPLMINNTVSRVVANHLVESSGDVLVGRMVILRSLH